MDDVFEWTNEDKLYVLEAARVALIARLSWDKTPGSLACLDAIIKDYEEKQND